MSIAPLARDFSGTARLGLALAVSGDRKVRVKPQNLLVNRPLAARAGDDRREGERRAMSIAPLARDFAGTARLGLALAVASAIGYGTMITATRLSYDAGSNPLTLICARAAVPAAILALLMLARGSAFALRPGALWPVAGIALGQLGITIGYLSEIGRAHV